MPGNTHQAEQVATNQEGPEPRVLSKKRRDLINAEIRELQNLLPLKKSARERLSYLGILALTNTFIRKATFFKKGICLLIKSYLSLYSLYYAEACHEFARPIAASLRPDYTAPFEEMSQRCQAVGNTVFGLPARDLNLRPSAPETSSLPLD